MEYPIKIKGKTVRQVKKLNLSGNNLKCIPDNVYEYSNLEKLDLSNNRITEIPCDILKLRKLRTLDLAFNQIKVLQSAIFKLPKLRILNLHGNFIHSLPKQLATSNLQTLIVSRNQIEQIDDALVGNLKVLDIVNNPVMEKKDKKIHDVESLDKNEMAMKQQKKKIFISYAHADNEYHSRLMTHLKVLKKYVGGFEEWSDQKIHAGAHWKQEISKALHEANIAILLVSTDFLASDFIQNNELPPILKKAENENTTILCLLVKPSMFLGSGLDEFQAINKPEKTLEDMNESERERTYLSLMGEIKRILEE